MTTKTTPFFLDDFDHEADTDLAGNDEKMDAAERDLRVLINAHAKETQLADERKAKEDLQRARVHAYYRRLAYCVIVALAAYTLTRIDAVSPVTAMIIAIAALLRMIPELFWIARRTIRFWTKKEENRSA